MRTIQLHLLLLGWLLALSCARPVEKPKVIAHRGYWQCEGSAQNSIASLVKAHEIGCYGSEFDVHLTADDVPVVCHEVEIRKGVFIPQVPYDSIKDIRLPNGETLPTLDQYLEKGKELEGLQLIYELKTDAAPERNRQAARVAVESVRKHGMEKRVEFITFNLEAAKELRRLAPDIGPETRKAPADTRPPGLSHARMRPRAVRRGSRRPRAPERPWRARARGSRSPPGSRSALGGSPKVESRSPKVESR